MLHAMMHASRFLFYKYFIWTTKCETNVGGRVWMPVAGQRHIGIHLWTDSVDGAAARDARSDEDQEEELTYGKCLVVVARTCLPHYLLIGCDIALLRIFDVRLASTTRYPSENYVK